MPKLTNDQLFHLYKRVQQKDRAAEDQLIAEHRIKFPNYKPVIKRGKSDRYREELHMIYLHLTR